MNERYEQMAEWVEMLEGAQEKMREAYDLISDYCRESGDANTEAYIADPLRILIDGDHGFISSEPNLGDVIHKLLHPED